METTKSQR